jgi:hypothetical protein
MTARALANCLQATRNAVRHLQHRSGYRQNRGDSSRGQGPGARVGAETRFVVLAVNGKRNLTSWLAARWSVFACRRH